MSEINIDSIINELKEDVEKALEKTSKDVMKEGLARIKKSSPRRTGEYARGWAQSKNKDTIVLHNKTKPGLTHLLEYDHALRGGGRSKPQKHIEKVQEFVEKEVERRIEQELKQNL